VVCISVLAAIVRISSSSSVAFPLAETTIAIFLLLYFTLDNISKTVLMPSPFAKDLPPNFTIFICYF
jgi:hypothetical protein